MSPSPRWRGVSLDKDERPLGWKRRVVHSKPWLKPWGGPTAAPSWPNPAPRGPGLRARGLRHARRPPTPRPARPPVPASGCGSAVCSAVLCSGHSLGPDWPVPRELPAAGGPWVFTEGNGTRQARSREDRGSPLQGRRTLAGPVVSSSRCFRPKWGGRPKE